MSNFNASLLRRLVKIAAIQPAVNQVGFSIAGHPAAHGGENATRYGCLEGSRLYGADDATLRLATARGITTQAYSPLGAISNVDVLGRREVQRVAAAHSREGGARNWTAAQVAFAWLLQQGMGAVTATTDARHAAEALDAAELRLTRREMRSLSRLRSVLAARCGWGKCGTCLAARGAEGCENVFFTGQRK